MGQDNRESWLNRMATGMAQLFKALDAPLTAAGPLPPAPCPARYRRRDDAAEEAGGAPLCPVIDHGLMHHDPLNNNEDVEMDDSG